MNVSVKIESKIVRASCEQKIARILQKRVDLRAKALENLMSEPGRIGRLFGIKARTLEQANAALAEDEREGKCDWQIMWENQRVQCEVIAKMSKYEAEIVLDYEAFCVVGLAR